MTEPPPPSTLRHAGDVVMLPIEGGLFPLPTTWWTANGLLPSDPLVFNPSYSISMGIQAQLHMYQECFGLDTVRIWAAFVEQPDINLQCDYVELFPYAEFPIEDCGDYEVNFPAIGTKKIFSYLPPNRMKPFQPSVPVSIESTGGIQYLALFRNL